MSKLVEDCPVFPSYIHANIAKTACVLATRPDLIDMKQAVDEDDYETFFEYRMDQYSKSGVVGRGATKATSELGEKLLGMVVKELVSIIQKALNEVKPKQRHRNNNSKSSNATKKSEQWKMSEKTRAYIITNIGALVAMIAVVINMFTFREMWILFTTVAVMIVLVAYAVQEKRKLKRKQTQNLGSP
jgi:cation transport ATPase